MAPRYQKIGEVEHLPPPPIEFHDAGGLDDTESRGRHHPVTKLAYACGSVFAVTLVAFGFAGGFSSPDVVSSKYRPADKLGPGVIDKLGRSVMKEFDTGRAFASFLPALGGEWGIPMWAFYVNRGQGITSYGMDNKDAPMMEFETASKAYQTSDISGFRTLLKGTRVSDGTFSHEPFKTRGDPDFVDVEVERNMFVGMNELEIEEVANKLGLQTNVIYTTVPNEDFAALVRRVTFTNLDEKEDLDLEVLDGPSKLIPWGSDDWHLKSMGRTLEAWMNVYNMEDSTNELPFFHLSMGLADTAQVELIEAGNWAVSFIEDPELKDGEKHDSLPFIVDPNVVFGEDTTLRTPLNFLEAQDGSSIKDLLATDQVTTSKTPCALSAVSIRVPAGGSVTLTSIYGHSPTLDTFMTEVVPKVTAKGFVSTKHEEAVGIIDRLLSKVATKSGSILFDLYTKQAYLDNLLRGGFPEVLGDGTTPKIYHTFSRIHGDLERDYNYFQIDSTYYSSGPGNFRDVNQNRRDDNKQEPLVGDFNALMFLSLVQPDGYNPLTVQSVLFVLPNDDEMGASPTNGTVTSQIAADTIASQVTVDAKSKKALTALLATPKGFQPGYLFRSIEEAAIKLTVSKKALLELVTSQAKIAPQAQFNQNGYWTDHWTYTLDLVESYLAIFPDKQDTFLFKSKVPFYYSPATCNPRERKYVDAPGLGPRQFDFIDPADPEKIAMLTKYGKQADGTYQRDMNGMVVEVSAYTKLLMLALTKFTILDPYGMGVEMEGGKPGWNDAMNGLPGLFGSSMPETFETLRILKFLERVTKHSDESITVPAEFDTLLKAAHKAVLAHPGKKVEDTKALEKGTSEADFEYWDTVRTALEKYRLDSRVTFSGETTDLTASELSKVLPVLIAKMEAGIARSIKIYGGMTPTYFIFEPTDFTKTGEVDWSGSPFIQVTGFGPPKHVPLFLEGPTRHMKVIEDKEQRMALYEGVKKTDMYDKALKMYTLSGSLKGMSPQIGRMMAFVPGWLENQSVWLHMSYKYYLELLRGGLHEEFFKELKDGLVAFMDPDVYGRPPIECSSFIASSAHPDKTIHGQGYLARLSGSTAEFLSMWNLMMMGAQPFVDFQVEDVDSGGSFSPQPTIKASTGEEAPPSGLTLALKPTLPSWLFDDVGDLSFTFLGAVNVTYHNPDFVNTYDDGVVVTHVSITDVGGTKKQFYSTGGVIPSPYAEDVRGGKYPFIEMHFSSETNGVVHNAVAAP